MLRITIKNPQKRISVQPKRIKKAVLKALSQEGAKKSGEITICFVNDSAIRRLNSRYLDKDNATDVIAFDITEPFDALRYKSSRHNNIFADIVVSTDRAWANARLFKTSPAYEMYLYVIHGVLHLLGYDDKRERQRRIMHDKAISILNTLRIS